MRRFIICLLILVWLLPERSYSQDQPTIANYPYAGTYNNLLPDIHPDINYINHEMVVQEAAISAVQPVSFNEIDNLIIDIALRKPDRNHGHRLCTNHIL